MIRGENFTGSVKEGGSVNFKEVMINPHANMTHTESVGHISKEEVPVNGVLNRFHFIAQLISVKPTLIDDHLENRFKKEIYVFEISGREQNSSQSGSHNH